LSICQGKEMAKPTSWQRKQPGGGDASRCILRDLNCSFYQSGQTAAQHSQCNC
jgi:hypothetical protein